MIIQRLLVKWTCSILICVLFTQSAFSQTKTITGKITDDKGAPVQGATVTAKGTKGGASTGADGTFKFTIPASANTLVITSIGFAQQEIDVSGKNSIDVSLVSQGQSLNDVVVVGYGTARRKDLTGSISSVLAKDFNKGQINSPEQLLQGKVAGLQITNSSGQPGGLTIVKIRGNNSIRAGNSPLYVLDGVPLDGRSPRPGANVSGVGNSPANDPLTYINPTDIANVEVLKDASASAIYGSRGANGVILITTRKGTTGSAKLDAGASVGVSDIMRHVKVLDAGSYRSALKQFSAPNSDSGANINPFDKILRSSWTQNYNVALGGGTENGKYHASFFMGNQDGIILKTNLKKYVGNFNGQYRFLENKLSLDFNVIAANVYETIAPISQDAGSGGNLISLGLIWNPTLTMQRDDGTFNQANPSGQVNPLALSAAYNDHANTTTFLGSVSAGYKITPWMEYKLLYGVNYGTGSRKFELQGWIKATGGIADGAGAAAIANTELISQTVTHTLHFNTKITSDLSLNDALLGYEYWTTTWRGNGEAVYGFDYNLDQKNLLPVHYYDNMQDGKQGNLSSFGFNDPKVEIQSYFARVPLSYMGKYLLTATFRADGSSKFGSNHKYAYFPSVAGKWVISNEDFMKNNGIFNNLAVRVGWGETGNQEFAADAALDVYKYTANGSISRSHYGNKDLKWETVKSVDAGLDFSILNNHVSGFIDYFNKKTTDPLFLTVISQPTAGGQIFTNLPGASLTNKGVEISILADLVTGKDFNWTINGNVTFVKNKFMVSGAGNNPIAFTGALHGQGTSGAYAQAIGNNQPVDVFYLPVFNGFDQKGIGQYSAGPVYTGDPNPTSFIGFSTNLSYKKWDLAINTHGSFGNKIYNNTAMSVLNISNILGGRNIASGLVSAGENTANAITPSTRFLESGSYFKLGNTTLTYKIGTIGHLRNFSVYVTGNNLFVISNYKGFDPEVNVDKALNGIPSLGIDYIGFPTQRTIMAGVNFSL